MPDFSLSSVEISLVLLSSIAINQGVGVPKNTLHIGTVPALQSSTVTGNNSSARISSGRIVNLACCNN